MCIPFKQSPLVFPVHQQMLDNQHERIFYIPILGKKVEKLNDGHVSSSNNQFRFPMRSFAWDSNAVIGSHDRCLHMAPNALVARNLSGYGNHTLAVLPGQHYWSSGDSGGRCHHSDGAFSLFCVECEGYDLEETTLPEFWEKEMPRSLVATIADAAQHGAYVGQVIRKVE